MKKNTQFSGLIIIALFFIVGLVNSQVGSVGDNKYNIQYEYKCHMADDSTMTSFYRIVYRELGSNNIAQVDLFDLNGLPLMVDVSGGITVEGTCPKDTSIPCSCCGGSHNNECDCEPSCIDSITLDLNTRSLNFQLNGCDLYSFDASAFLTESDTFANDLIYDCNTYDLTVQMEGIDNHVENLACLKITDWECVNGFVVLTYADGSMNVTTNTCGGTDTDDQCPTLTGQTVATGYEITLSLDGCTDPPQTEIIPIAKEVVDITCVNGFEVLLYDDNSTVTTSNACGATVDTDDQCPTLTGQTVATGYEISLSLDGCPDPAQTEIIPIAKEVIDISCVNGFEVILYDDNSTVTTSNACGVVDTDDQCPTLTGQTVATGYEISLSLDGCPDPAQTEIIPIPKEVVNINCVGGFQVLVYDDNSTQATTVPCTTNALAFSSPCTAYNFVQSPSGVWSMNINFPDCATANVGCPCKEACPTDPGQVFLMVKQ